MGLVGGRLAGGGPAAATAAAAAASLSSRKPLACQLRRARNVGFKLALSKCGRCGAPGPSAGRPLLPRDIAQRSPVA